MTAEQVLGIAQTATEMLSGTQAPAAPAAPAAPTFADDEYMTGRQFREALAAQRPDDTAITLAADANLAHIRTAHADIVGKYGAEFNAYVARVPAAQRTIDNLTQIVKLVRSDHVDEIVSERAAQLASTIAPTLRPTGGGAPLAPVSRDASLESEKIPQEWKDRARAAKIDENTVAEFCRANGMTTAAFYKQFDTPMNNIVGEVGRVRHA